MSEDYFTFIIDTNRYSGNFEREMCAYITNQVGGCGVGDELLNLFNKEDEEYLSWIESNIQHRDDEGDGCLRPCYIYPTEGRRAYESVAIFFYKPPPESVIYFMKERAKEFAEHYGQKYTRGETLEVKGFRLSSTKLVEEITHI